MSNFSILWFQLIKRTIVYRSSRGQDSDPTYRTLQLQRFYVHGRKGYYYVSGESRTTSDTTRDVRHKKKNPRNRHGRNENREFQNRETKGEFTRLELVKNKELKLYR